MRKTLLFAPALAAFAVVGACGTASAISNNLHSDAIQKPPAASAKVIVRDHRKPASKPASTSTQPATSTTSSAIQTTGTPTVPPKPGKPAATQPMQKPAAQTPPPKPKSVAELQKDISNKQEVLARVKDTEANNANKVQSDLASNQYHWNPNDPKQMKCDTGGKCVGNWPVAIADPSGSGKTITKVFQVPVDSTGAPAAGAQDVLVQASKFYYDSQINTLNKQISADYYAMPNHGLNSGGMTTHQGSTAVHQD